MHFLARPILWTFPPLFSVQIRTVYGRKKLVTVWHVGTGRVQKVDIRDAGKKKYKRIPPTHPAFEMSNVKKKLKGWSGEPEEIRVSKTISWLLRHGARSEGLAIGHDGYVRVQDLVRPFPCTARSGYV